MSFVEARVTGRRDWAAGLMTLTLDASVAAFKPGQFFNLGLELGGEPVFRAYSAASPPGQPLEFFLSEVAGGVLSPALFRLQCGDRILVDPSGHGFFTLDWVPPAPELWMIATGTGLGPFLSMLRAEEPFRRFQRIVVVHGVRETSHLAYATELMSLSAQHGGCISWVPVVSRDPSAPRVVHGRVTTALADGSLERAARLTLSPEASHVLLCGNPAMIDAMLEALAARGLARHRTRRPGHVTVEKYWE